MPPRKSGLRHRLSASEADFRADHNILPPIAQQLSEHDFGLSLRVPIGGIEKIDSSFERLAYESPRPLHIDFGDGGEPGVRPERHRAEGESRNDQACISKT